MPSVYEKLYAIILKEYPAFAGAWEAARIANGEAWEMEFSERVGRLFGTTANDAWNEAVGGYAEFCTDALRAQIYFERFGKYPANNYRDVTEACYLDSDYMNRRYLPGQYLSHYIWPHHYRMMKRYSSNILGMIGNSIESFCEVGVGCGMYSLQTLLNREGIEGIGFDISPYSTAFTQRVIDSHALSNRYRLHTRDAFSEELDEPVDLVVSQEVLEHLPDPGQFIAQLRSLVKPKGLGYITAAINAAHTDHIYLYRSPDEVAVQLTEAGWEILDQQIESNYPDKRADIRPTIAGYLVRSTS